MGGREAAFWVEVVKRCREAIGSQTGLEPTMFKLALLRNVPTATPRCPTATRLTNTHLTLRCIFFKCLQLGHPHLRPRTAHLPVTQPVGSWVGWWVVYSGGVGLRECVSRGLLTPLFALVVGLFKRSVFMCMCVLVCMCLSSCFRGLPGCRGCCGL